MKKEEDESSGLSVRRFFSLNFPCRHDCVSSIIVFLCMYKRRTRRKLLFYTEAVVVVDLHVKKISGKSITPKGTTREAWATHHTQVFMAVSHAKSDEPGKTGENARKNLWKSYNFLLGYCCRFFFGVDKRGRFFVKMHKEKIKLAFFCLVALAGKRARRKRRE